MRCQGNRPGDAMRGKRLAHATYRNAALSQEWRELLQDPASDYLSLTVEFDLALFHELPFPRNRFFSENSLALKILSRL
jgi:hypothetical protein